MSGFMFALITTIHIIACIALMVSILLQAGKGGGLAGAFGAGSSQTLFGGRGAATFLSRASTVLAVTFFLTSLTLGLSETRRAGGPGRSLIQDEARRRSEQRGSAPAAGGPASAPAAGTPLSSAPGQTPAPPSATPAPQGGGAPQGEQTK
jgi:preprotein translocase subunit SecG